MVQEIFFIAHVKTREILCISVYLTAFYLHNVKIFFDIKSLLLVKMWNQEIGKTTYIVTQ